MGINMYINLVFCEMFISGSGGVYFSFACSWDPFPPIGLSALPYFEGLFPFLLYLVMPCLTDILERPDLSE